IYVCQCGRLVNIALQVMSVARACLVVLIHRQPERHVETVIRFSAFALALWLMVQYLVRSPSVRLYLESGTSFHTARAM
ncbi:hypothetical protein BDR07DRAFT_1445145, partial [Suillus spraguei]